MARLRDPDGGCPWHLEQDFHSISRHLGLDAEQSLRQGNDRLEGRCCGMEVLLRENGRSFSTSTPVQLHALWETVRLEQDGDA